MGFQQSCVDSEVGRGTRIRLHVDTPSLLVEVKSLECTILTKILHFVHHLVTAVVTGARLAFGVLIGEARAKGLHNGLRCEIFRGNQFDASATCQKRESC